MPKTTKPMIRIHNAETDEVIDREMTNAEFAQYELDQANELQIKNEIKAKAADKQALLERLGITADEAKLLLG
jgi:hypothetical protein